MPELKPNQCKECPHICKNAQELDRHSTFHSAENKFLCDYCTYSVDRLNNMTFHRKKHAPHVKNFESNPSSDTLLRIGSCQTIKPKSPQPVSESTEDDKNDGDAANILQCDRCPYKVNIQRKFSMHVQNHGAQKKYLCDCCDYSVERANLLAIHRKLHAFLPNFDSEKDCAFLMNPAYPHKNTRRDSLDSSRDRSRSHSGSRSGSRSGSAQQRETSVQKDDTPTAKSQGDEKPTTEESTPTSGNKNPKQLSCTKCSYHTVQPRLLASHMRLHDSDTKHNCQFCDYDTNDFYKLRQHLRLHAVLASSDVVMDENANEEGVDNKESKKCHKCDRCPYQTYNETSLEAHVKQHLVISKLQCAFCDYYSGRPVQLASHIKIHFPGAVLEPHLMSKLVDNATSGPINSPIPRDVEMEEIKSPTRRTRNTPSEKTVTRSIATRMST
eukprot:GHVU01203738.1.p1 GENE.GHVU01203738.1~~GHVU01203738.1.p1  ORF type:complete len:500 (-),score=34.59 GHVU01203738.1:2226-3545(-)